MRPNAILIIGVLLTGCTDGLTSEPKVSIGQASALKAARQWVSEQGVDSSSCDFSIDPDGTDWSVLIEYQPPTPGGHTILKVDSRGKVIEVIPGA